MQHPTGLHADCSTLHISVRVLILVCEGSLLNYACFIEQRNVFHLVVRAVNGEAQLASPSRTRVGSFCVAPAQQYNSTNSTISSNQLYATATLGHADFA
jgi:hypothetical protein